MSPPVPLIAALAALAQTPAGPPATGPVGPIFSDPSRIGQPPLPEREQRLPPAPLPQPRTAAPTPSVLTAPRPRLSPDVDQLPDPTADPLRIDRARDPILGLSRSSTSAPEFMALIQQAVDRSPRVGEAAAGITEAQAVRREARAALYPSGDVNLNGTQSIVRDFGANDVDNIVERSRGRSRVDLTSSINQIVFDWGATSNRIEAAGARLRAAAAQAEVSADDVALRAIAAWYDVFAYRALVGLSSSFSAGQQELRGAIETRIRQGVSAPGDLPRVESYIASADADLARYRRQLANAEARYTEIFGAPPPPGLGRAPIIPGPTLSSRDAAQALARAAPQVQSAEALARAARREARAEYRATLPSLTAGIDAGRYDLIDSSDYDVRGRATVRYRFLGGIEARVEQSEARATQAEARASTVREEAEREAAIAWSDVQALQQQLAALENSYVASRQSRDVLAERFRVARGTLFDLLESESGYFNVAALYVRAITELDAARYVLLSRTGQLLPTLSVEAPGTQTQ